MKLPPDISGQELVKVLQRIGFVSARQLILASIEQAVSRAERTRPQRRLSLELPLVPARGRKPCDLTNEQIYRLIELL